MDGDRIRRVAILGGGTAGWMTAAALAQAAPHLFEITLVESDEIGIIGVGEATIPTIHWFNQMVGLDAEQFMRDTRATFKLGIEFVDWYAVGERYMHPFGRYGLPADPVPFHHRWIRARRATDRRFDFEHFALATIAARAGRFALPSSDPRSPLANLGYAYHFDASLYARFLRTLSEARGVQRIEGRVTAIERDENGDVRALRTDKGAHLTADLFVDCSGMRALLIGEQCAVPYEDWSRWLPCDRALAVPCALPAAPEPHTRATARTVGWQWRIPLQHRIGNGLVYSSEDLADDEAAAMLLANLDGEPLAAPRPIRFKAGRRLHAWTHNVVAIGLSAGFLEPLESTSIHLIQSAIAKLLSLFPARDTMALSARQFNRLMQQEYDGVRDFLILHYHSTSRSEPFWQKCRAAQPPDSLLYKVEQFERTGRLMLETDELFREASWFSVLVGQNHLPRDYNPLIDVESPAVNAQLLGQQRQTLAAAAASMPTHAAVLDQLTKSSPASSKRTA
jgi:tryptophan 7-halogenase